ncbi:hypothetical protein D3C72_2512580 [compost metagenome]
MVGAARRVAVFLSLQMMPENVVNHINMVQRMHHVSDPCRPLPKSFTIRQTITLLNVSPFAQAL